MQRTKDWLTKVRRQDKAYILSNCVSNLAFNWMRRISMIQLEIAESHRVYSIGYSVIPLKEQGKRWDNKPL